MSGPRVAPCKARAQWAFELGAAALDALWSVEGDQAPAVREVRRPVATLRDRADLSADVERLFDASGQLRAQAATEAARLAAHALTARFDLDETLLRDFVWHVVDQVAPDAALTRRVWPVGLYVWTLRRDAREIAALRCQEHAAVISPRDDTGNHRRLLLMDVLARSSPLTCEDARSSRAIWFLIERHLEAWLESALAVLFPRFDSVPELGQILGRVSTLEGAWTVVRRLRRAAVLDRSGRVARHCVDVTTARAVRGIDLRALVEATLPDATDAAVRALPATVDGDRAFAEVMRFERDHLAAPQERRLLAMIKRHEGRRTEGRRAIVRAARAAIRRDT
ncbi:MAG: hypothetical protein U0326_33145 [Polyangiales bacterium]